MIRHPNIIAAIILAAGIVVDAEGIESAINAQSQASAKSPPGLPLQIAGLQGGTLHIEITGMNEQPIPVKIMP